MPTRNHPTPPPTDMHKRAVAAVQELFRLFPMEAAAWVASRVHDSKKPFRVLEASFIEQPRRGPAYAVPPPLPSPAAPATPEALIKKIFADALARDAAASGGTVELVSFDLEEERRQAIARGGCEVELLLRAQVGRGKPFPTLLGVALPGEHEDGSEMQWHVLEKVAWHLAACRALILEREPDARPSFEAVPIYLWPGTGLKDPQEDCSVMKGGLNLPGLLGALLQARSDKEKAREQEQNRKANRDRLDYHRALDRKRRESAAKRRELMGDAGITEEELDALVPEIDIDNDHYTMRLCYSIVRLWEEPVDALLEELPPECVGLSLFGYRRAGVTAEDVLGRCAWVLRRGVRGADAQRAERAAVALAALAAVHIDPDEVKRMLSLMF